MLLDILHEHLEEAEMLWARRRLAAWSPDLELAGLEAIDDRLSAHLEGGALGSRESSAAFEAALRGQDADAAFAAAAALLVAREQGLSEVVVGALGAASPQAVRGITEALCHQPLTEHGRLALERRLRLTAAQDPAAIDVLSFHHVPMPGALESAAESTHPWVRRAAARAFGRLGGGDAWIERLAAEDATEVRDGALEAAARRGLRWVVGRLRAVCARETLVSAASLRLLSCVGDLADIEMFVARAGSQVLGEAAVAGLATLGYSACADLLVKLAGEERLARGAGRAFARISGIEPPAIEEQALAVAIEDAGFDDLRRLPDPAAMRALWRDRAPAFDTETRWRMGARLESGQWRNAPHRGDLLMRREELTRLWLGAPALYRELEPDAPAARQRAATAGEEAEWAATM